MGAYYPVALGGLLLPLPDPLIEPPPDVVRGGVMFYGYARPGPFSRGTGVVTGVGFLPETYLLEWTPGVKIRKTESMSMRRSLF